MLHWIGRRIRNGSYVRIEVVDATGADVGDVFQAHRTENCLSIAAEPKLLLPEPHIDSEGRNTRGSVE